MSDKAAGGIYMVNEYALVEVEGPDDSPVVAFAEYKILKTAEQGETFIDFWIDPTSPEALHLETVEGVYTGRPNSNGGIDWKFEVKDGK